MCVSAHCVEEVYQNRVAIRCLEHGDGSTTEVRLAVGSRALGIDIDKSGVAVSRKADELC